MDYVEIKWIDSWGVNSEWESRESALAHEICTIYTVGHLIKRDNNQIWVALSHDTKTEMVCGVMVIPKKCIIEIRNLKVV